MPGLFFTPGDSIHYNESGDGGECQVDKDNPPNHPDFVPDKKQKIEKKYRGTKIVKGLKIRKAIIGSRFLKVTKAPTILIGMCKGQMAVIPRYIRQKINMMS